MERRTLFTRLPCRAIIANLDFAKGKHPSEVIANSQEICNDLRVVVPAKQNQEEYMVARGKNWKSLLVQSTVKEHCFSFTAVKLIFKKTKRPFPLIKKTRTNPKLARTQTWNLLSPLVREVLEGEVSSYKEFLVRGRKIDMSVILR